MPDVELDLYDHPVNRPDENWSPMGRVGDTEHAHEQRQILQAVLSSH